MTELCPTPWKIRFASRGEAKNMVKQADSRTGKKRGQQRPYQCESGDHWHLTTMPKIAQRRYAKRKTA